jgi:hypothetical protein
MTTDEFNDIINSVLDIGITVLLNKHNGIIWYDVDTGMKSHLELALIDGKCTARGRYNRISIINNFEELCVEVSLCRYGKDFGNLTWIEYLRENKYL